jgi:hypothetical protein
MLNIIVNHYHAQHLISERGVNIGDPGVSIYDDVKVRCHYEQVRKNW